MSEVPEMFLELFVERPPTPWMSQGACRGLDPDLFFPVQGSTQTSDHARVVCATCPVRQPCEDYGTEYERFGVWGGKTAEELRLARKAKARLAA